MLGGGSIELNEKTSSVSKPWTQLCATSMSNLRISNVPERAKGVWMKLSEYIEEDFELNQKTMCTFKLTNKVYLRFHRNN